MQAQALSARLDRAPDTPASQVLALVDDDVTPPRFMDSEAFQHASRHLADAGFAVVLTTPSRAVASRFGQQLPLTAADDAWRVRWHEVAGEDGAVAGWLGV